MSDTLENANMNADIGYTAASDDSLSLSANDDNTAIIDDDAAAEPNSPADESASAGVDQYLKRISIHGSC